MSAEMALLKAAIEAWAINAKREKEANRQKPKPRRNMLENRYAWLIQLLETGENITHADSVLQNRQAWFDELIKENALVHSGNVSRLICPQCDEPHDIAVDPSTFKGYCVDAGYVSFEPKRIMQYQASPQWVIEANQSGELCHEWRGQEIAFKRVQDLLTKAGIV